MMTHQEVEMILSQVLKKESAPYDLPTADDWKFLRHKFGTDFPNEFISFIELMSTYAFPGEILNVARTGNTNGNDQIASAFDSEMQNGKWNPNLVPFYAIGNGDYFCLSSKEGRNSPVYYYYHEDAHHERFAMNFDSWLNGLKAFLAGQNSKNS